MQIKGTFNPRRQGRSVRNPYTQRNCCANFCTVICGPFPPRCVYMGVYICVCGGEGDYITSPPTLLLAYSLRGMKEGQAMKEGQGYFIQAPYSFPGLLFPQSTRPTRVREWICSDNWGRSWDRIRCHKLCAQSEYPDHTHIVQGSRLTPEHLFYRHFRMCSS